MGRPVDQRRARLRQMFPEWSDRTFARYYGAFRATVDVAERIGEPEWGFSVIRRANAAASRPGGGFNVTKFVDVCDTARAVRAVEWLSQNE